MKAAQVWNLLFNRPCFRAVAVTLAVSMAISAPCRDVTAGDLPRYALKVGQELHYTGEGSFKYGENSIDSTADWKIWVTRRNDNGSWRLIVRNADGRGSKEAADENANVSLASFDLFPDGSFAENASFGYRLEPRKLFAKLPADETEMKGGWAARDAASETTYHYKSSSEASPAGDWQFSSSVDGPFNKIYLSTSDSEIAFDRAQGVVREINTKLAQKWGFDGAGTNQLKLQEVSERDADWIAALDRDLERYSKAEKQYEELTERLELAADPEARVKEASELWSKARGEVTSEIVQQAIDRQIKQGESIQNYLLQGAKDKLKVLGKAAANWDTTDLDGTPHRLADYAGKVVVLDFWYRGCGWCIRAMPQINQVAEDFAAEPVAILGMNTDSNVDDAKFVAEAMKLKYPSMRIDRELPKEYGVSGFPTLLVIDQAGVVRDIHVGYSPNLRETLTASIRELLKNKPAATAEKSGSGSEGK
jgi:thiol-disulfide isomerase/thioredoxin